MSSSGYPLPHRSQVVQPDTPNANTKTTASHPWPDRNSLPIVRRKDVMVMLATKRKGKENWSGSFSKTGQEVQPNSHGRNVLTHNELHRETANGWFMRNRKRVVCAKPQVIVLGWQFNCHPNFYRPLKRPALIPHPFSPSHLLAFSLSHPITFHPPNRLGQPLVLRRMVVRLGGNPQKHSRRGGPMVDRHFDAESLQQPIVIPCVAI